SSNFAPANCSVNLRRPSGRAERVYNSWRFVRAFSTPQRKGAKQSHKVPGADCARVERSFPQAHRPPLRVITHAYPEEAPQTNATDRGESGRAHLARDIRRSLGRSQPNDAELCTRWHAD